MDAELIRRWNIVVEPGDIVYHLGDFTLNGWDYADKIFRQLNGIINILSNPWHHDKRWLKVARTNPPMSQGGDFYVRKIAPMKVLELEPLSEGGYPLKITLCHYPMASWEASYHGSWHLHGHSHGTWNSREGTEGSGYIMDVGVDSWAFAPVTLKEVRTYMKGQEEQKHPRQGGGQA